MALSGALSTKWKGYTYRIYWSATQNVGNNISAIAVDHWLDCDSGWDLYIGSRSNTCVVGSSSANFTSPAVSTGGNSSIKLGTTNHSVTHNNDGSMSCAINTAFKIDATISGSYRASLDISGTLVLNTIPRASQPSCITWPEHTQNVGNFGDTISIHMNRKSTSFTHNVYYKFGTTIGECYDADTGERANAVTTGFNWTIPLELMNLIPDSPSGSGTIFVETFNGSTLIDTKSCGFTATVSDDIRPTCTFTLDDITGIDDIYGSPVQGLSKIKVAVTPTLAYGSPIKAYKITVDGKTYTSQEATTDVLVTDGSSPVTVTVTDARNRSNDPVASYTMTVQEYSKPFVDILTAERCNQDGTLNKKGSHLKITFSAKVTALANKNTAEYYIGYKKTSDAAYTAISDISSLNGSYSPSSSYIISAAKGNAYEVIATATDSHYESAPKTAKAATAEKILSWRGFKKNNVVEDGLGIGKIPDRANALQVGWETEFDNSVIFGGNHYTMSSPGTAGSGGYVLMAQIEVTAADADTPITFVFSRRQEISTSTVHVQLRNASGTQATLQSLKYEGSNYDVYLSPSGGSPSNVWNLYVKKGSNYDTITLQNWWTSKTMESRVSLTFPGTLISTLPTPNTKATSMLLDQFYPKNSIYISYSHTDPAILFGGTWERITNAFLWGTDSNGTIGHEGGEKTHVLTENEMPIHTHKLTRQRWYGNDKVENENTGAIYGISTTTTKSYSKVDGSDLANTGGGAAHNNMPPYIQVSIWRRTA